MKLPNDTKIKTLFNNQEIQPSPQAWDTLAELLDKQIPEEPVTIQTPQPNKSKIRPFMLWFASAAVVVLVCGIGFTVLNQEQNSNQVITHVDTLNQPIKNVIETKDEFVTKNVENLAPVSKPNHVLAVSQPIQTKDTDLKYSSKISYQTLQSDITENQVSSPVNQDNTVAESSLKINWKTNKKQQYTVKQQQVLQTVERELTEEHTEKVLNNRYQKFEQIRMAVINRNFEE